MVLLILIGFQESSAIYWSPNLHFQDWPLSWVFHHFFLGFSVKSWQVSVTMGIFVLIFILFWLFGEQEQKTAQDCSGNMLQQGKTLRSWELDGRSAFKSAQDARRKHVQTCSSSFWCLIVMWRNQIPFKLLRNVNSCLVYLLLRREHDYSNFPPTYRIELIILRRTIICLSSVQFSRSLMSDSLRPHGLQHTKPSCPSPTPEACSNSCPSGQWCHQTISSSVIPFSSRLQSFQASGSFP